MNRTAIFVAPLFCEHRYKRVTARLESSNLLFEDMAASKWPDRHDEWTLDSEVANLERARQASGQPTRVDLIGYSGGAAACLAYAAAHPELVKSLTLIEPPWIGNDVWSEEEAAWRAQYDAIADVPDHDVWDAIFALLNSEHATPVPAVMTGKMLRDAFMLVWRGYSAAPLDRRRLERIDVQVYLPVGGASAPRMLPQAECLARHFPNAEIEVLEGLGHFDILSAGAERIAAGISRSWKK